MSRIIIVWFNKRGMKTLAKKIGLEKNLSQGVKLFTRSKVGSHLSVLLNKGKANSIVICVTHEEKIGEIETIDCDFSALAIASECQMNENIINKKSRAILTIVNNNTLDFMNKKILHRLKYKTSLTHEVDQEALRKRVLFMSKLEIVSKIGENKDPLILYQTKRKIEAVSLLNKERMVELIGCEAYKQWIEPFLYLSNEIGEQKISIAKILIEKADKEGIGNLLSMIEKIQ